MNWRNDISSKKTKNLTAAYVWKAGQEEYEAARKSSLGKMKSNSAKH